MPELTRLDSATKSPRHSTVRKAWLGSLAAVALFGGHCADAAQTPAGTLINNVAHVSYALDSVKNDLASNPVNVEVNELIELTVTPAPACVAPAAADGTIAIGFLVTNIGNGHEAFIPDQPEVIGDSNFVPEAVVYDTNHDGCYEPGIDTVIPAGGKTPELAPGQSAVIFVIGKGWSGTGKVVIRVKSATGTGAVGSAIVGAGDGGSDAVIGTTGGASGDVPGTPPNPLQASLIKSQVVLAPDGTAQPMRGATITYSIEARFAGGGTASGVVIADPIPGNTVYVPGSLTIDGAVLSDAADNDAGSFDGTAVSVALGDVPAPATHSVTFKVKIN